MQSGVLVKASTQKITTLISEQTKTVEAKSSIESTPSSSTQLQPVSQYPFVKLASHFEKKEEILKIPDLASYHSIVKIKKNFKPGSSADRNNSHWIRINNTTVAPIYRARLDRIIVLAGELFRFLDNEQVKYRIFKDEKQEYPISKEITGGEELHEYLNKNLQFKYSEILDQWECSHNVCFDGMGRGILGKYVYGDIDFHTGNAFLNAKKYFCVIDHDRCFYPVTLPMHTNVIIKGPLSLNVMDYDNLPVLVTSKFNKDHNWNWNNREGANIVYAYTLARNEVFLNEKHFATLKILTTQKLQLNCVSYHINNSEDENNLKSFLTKRYIGLLNIIENSVMLMTYLRANRLDVIKTILFELKDFFAKNKHYIPKNNLAIGNHWKKMALHVIECYSVLLLKLKEKILDKDEIQLLSKYSESCSTNEDEIKAAKLFYTNQKMHSYANKCVVADDKKTNLFDSNVIKVNPSESTTKVEVVVIKNKP